MEKVDEDLIMEFKEGNQAAFEALFRRHKRSVFNFALRLLGQRADAEDVTSEVFMIMLNGKFESRPNAKFTTWLYTVTRNACISKIRQRKRHVSMWFFRSNEDDDPTAWEPADTAHLPSDELHRKEKIKIIKNVISKMQGLQRDALILREYQSLSYSEIGCVLGTSVDNVKVLIFRGREHLRQQLVSMKEDLHG